MDVKEIKAVLDFNLTYGGFSINISNTHDRKVRFKLSEYNGKSWVEIPNTAAEYILKDFKQTEEYKKIKLLYSTVLKDYGF